MAWFANMRIANKLLAAFAAVLILQGALGVISLKKISAVQDVARNIGGNGVLGTRAVGNLAFAVDAYRRWEMRILIAMADPKQLESSVQALPGFVEQVKKARTEYEPTIDDPEERRLYETFAAQWELYLNGSKRFLELANSAKPEQARVLLLGEGLTNFNAMIQTINTDIGFQEKMTTGDVMSRSVFSCQVDQALQELWETMNARSLRCAPVLDGSGRPQGVVHARELARALLAEVSEEEVLLRDYVLGVGYW